MIFAAFKAFAALAAARRRARAHALRHGRAHGVLADDRVDQVADVRQLGVLTHRRELLVDQARHEPQRGGRDVARADSCSYVKGPPQRAVHVSARAAAQLSEATSSRSILAMEIWTRDLYM